MLACTVPPGSSSISGRMMEMVLPVSIVSLQALPPTVPDKVSPSTAPRTDPALKDIGCLSFSNGISISCRSLPLRPATARFPGPAGGVPSHHAGEIVDSFGICGPSAYTSNRLPLGFCSSVLVLCCLLSPSPANLAPLE